MIQAVIPHLPQDQFSGGAKAGWWVKTIQLDLEAKGELAREANKLLGWHGTLQQRAGLVMEILQRDLSGL
jgi:hypothetical protein